MLAGMIFLGGRITSWLRLDRCRHQENQARDHTLRRPDAYSNAELGHHCRVCRRFASVLVSERRAVHARLRVRLLRGRGRGCHRPARCHVRVTLLFAASAARGQFSVFLNALLAGHGLA